MDHNKTTELSVIVLFNKVIIIMEVKTSGCPDILYNDWAASRSQSMQRPKSFQLKSQFLIIKILVIKFLNYLLSIKSSI